MKSQITLLALVVVADSLLRSVVCTATPIGTAFTYQGRFNDGGSSANGAYDFEFRLFDAATAGNQVGSAIAKDNLEVNDGYFTTTLDFGSGIFTGDARWLQIAVRPGNETGAYTTLTPRHELTPNPYAINSDHGGATNYLPKFTASGLVNSVLYESSGKIGVGTSQPLETLAVAGNLHLSADSPYLYWNSHTLNLKSRNNCIPYVAIRGSASYDPKFVMSNAGDAEMNIQINTNGVSYLNGGRVGIGTTTPSHLLTTADTGAVNAVNLSNVLYVDAANNRVGIGFDNPVWALDMRTDYPLINVQGIGNPALELRSTNGGYPYLDFSNDASIDYDMRLWILGDDTLTIDGGNVGIGTTAPTQVLHVNGNIQCEHVYESSDEQLKTDVQSLTGVLDRLGQVRAVSFRWNEKARSLGAMPGEKQIGVLAQELEQVFPELVATPKPVTVEELSKGYSEETLTPEVKQRLQRDAEATNYKAVNYSRLTVVLLEAVKELREENEMLRTQNNSLEERLVRLENVTLHGAAK